MKPACSPTPPERPAPAQTLVLRGISRRRHDAGVVTLGIELIVAAVTVFVAVAVTVAVFVAFVVAVFVVPLHFPPPPSPARWPEAAFVRGVSWGRHCDHVIIAESSHNTLTSQVTSSS